MPEREQTRLRERDRAAENQHPYEVFFDAFKERRAQAENGQIVIKGKDLPWQQSRQGRSKYFLHLRAEDRAMQDWMLFQKDIMTESGAHTHQGGLVIYVTRGAGYSVFDGVEHHWKPGDLLILPVKPGGVEHQHFNYDDEQSSQWVAFIFIPFLLIDMIVSSTLMSMGMVMLPPVFISLPFKILLFVLVDGWDLVTRSLVQSFH